MTEENDTTQTMKWNKMVYVKMTVKMKYEKSDILRKFWNFLSFIHIKEKQNKNKERNKGRKSKTEEKKRIFIFENRRLAHSTVVWLKNWNWSGFWRTRSALVVDPRSPGRSIPLAMAESRPPFSRKWAWTASSSVDWTTGTRSSGRRRRAWRWFGTPIPG